MIPTTNAALRELINAYGRACRRYGSPAWESIEGQALNAALTTTAAVPRADDSKSRLLSALERAAAAETVLRALLDECETDSIPGWEDRMNARITEANRVLAAAPKAEPVTVTGIPATLPSGWVPLTITHDGQHPEEVAYGPQIMMDRLRKWLDRYFAMLTAPQPAIQQEPVAWANWKVGSTSYVPYRTREHAAASVRQSEIAATQEGPYEVVALYREPLQAAPAAQGDALDSDRLNWLEANAQITIERLRRIGSEKRVYEVASNDDEIYGEGDTLREAIDAARAAKEGA